MNMASAARMYALNVPYDQDGTTFLDWDQMTRNCFVFVSSVKVMLSKSLYDPSVPKHTLQAKFYQGFVGNSSTASPITFYVPGMKEPLFEQLNQVVTVDRATRRPTPMPDWFKEKYKGKGVINEPFIVKPKPKPIETFTHKIHVQWSDTDMYEHTNFTSYPKFVVDSVKAALWHQSRDGCSALKGLTEEIVDNGLKLVEICYLQQTVFGDMLEIHVWQEDGNSHKVICSLCCDEVEVCQIYFEYYDSA